MNRQRDGFGFMKRMMDNTTIILRTTFEEVAIGIGNGNEIGR